MSIEKKLDKLSRLSSLTEAAFPRYDNRAFNDPDNYIKNVVSSLDKYAAEITATTKALLKQLNAPGFRGLLDAGLDIDELENDIDNIDDLGDPGAKKSSAYKNYKNEIMEALSLLRIGILDIDTVVSDTTAVLDDLITQLSPLMISGLTKFLKNTKIKAILLSELGAKGLK